MGLYRFVQRRVEVTHGCRVVHERGWIAERSVTLLGFIRVWVRVAGADYRTIREVSVEDARRDAALRKPLDDTQYMEL